MKKLIVSALILLLSFSVVSGQANFALLADRAGLNDLPIPPTQSSFSYEPRQITEIVIHHSGSFPYDDTPEANQKAVNDYRYYHTQIVHPGVYDDPSTWAIHYDENNQPYKMPAQEGYPDGRSAPAGYDYNDIDYHFLVGTDGNIYKGRDINTVGWHCSNWEANIRSIGVCFIGCFSLVKPNEQQYLAGVKLLAELINQYHITVIRPHRYYKNTECPGNAFPFDEIVKDAFKLAGIFEDFNWNHWAYNIVSPLIKDGYIKGYDNGYLYPENSITRGEFIYLIWEKAGFIQTSNKYSFPDIKDYWGSYAIDWAFGRGLVNGYDDGLFYPNKPITRAEACTIIARLLYLFPIPATFPDTVGHWANGSIGACQYLSYVYGYDDGYFRPDQNLTRVEAFVILTRLP